MENGKDKLFREVEDFVLKWKVGVGILRNIEFGVSYGRAGVVLVRLLFILI